MVSGAFDLPTSNRSIRSDAILVSQSVAKYLVGVGGQVDQFVRHCKFSLVAGKDRLTFPPFWL